MSRYVGLGGNVEYSPPIEADRVRMYSFLLPASQEHLDRALHARFTEPSQGAVMAVSALPFVALYVSVIPAIRLRDNVGWYSERESGVMMFGVDLVSNQLFTTLDYLYVDSGQAMANGREIFGFPKHIGMFSPDDPWLDNPEMSRPEQSPDAFTLETLGVRRFGVDARAAKYDLWHIERSGGGGTPIAVDDPRGMLELYGAALKGFGSPHLVDGQLHPFAHRKPTDTLDVNMPYYPPLGQGGEVTLETSASDPVDGLNQARMSVPFKHLAGTTYNLIDELAQNRLSTLLLKQVRSATRFGMADYSAVLQLSASTNLRAAGLLAGDYTVEVNPLDSAPMADTFGWSGPVPSVISSYLEYDFTYAHAKTLWSSSAANPIAGF